LCRSRRSRCRCSLTLIVVLRGTVGVVLPIRLVVRVLVGEDVLHGLSCPFHLARMQAASHTARSKLNCSNSVATEYVRVVGCVVGGGEVLKVVDAGVCGLVCMNRADMQVACCCYRVTLGVRGASRGDD
jgi:hypothetical protein